MRRKGGRGEGGIPPHKWEQFIWIFATKASGVSLVSLVLLLSVFASPINRNSSTKLPGREINGSLVISTPAWLPACLPGLPVLPKSTPFSICTLINWNIAAGSHCFQLPVTISQLPVRTSIRQASVCAVWGSPWSLPARCPGSALSLGHKNSFPVVTHSWQSKWCQNRKSSYLEWGGAKRAKPEKRNFKICISMRSKSAALREMKRKVDLTGQE